MWIEYRLKSGEEITLNLNGVKKFVRFYNKELNIYRLDLVYLNGCTEVFKFKDRKEREDVYRILTKDFVRRKETIKDLIGV